MKSNKKIYIFAIVAIIISILGIGYNVTKVFLINKQDRLLDISELEQAEGDINWSN